MAHKVERNKWWAAAVAVFSLLLSTVGVAAGPAGADTAGLQWADPVVVSPQEVAEFEGASSRTGSVVVVAFATSGGDGYVASSVDAGRSWTDPVKLGDQPVEPGTLSAAVSADGAVATVAWGQKCPGGECAYARTSAVAGVGAGWRPVTQLRSTADVTRTAVVVSAKGGADPENDLRRMVGVCSVGQDSGGQWSLECRESEAIGKDQNGLGENYEPPRVVDTSSESLDGLAAAIMSDYVSLAVGQLRSEYVVGYTKVEGGDRLLNTTLMLNTTGINRAVASSPGADAVLSRTGANPVGEITFNSYFALNSWVESTSSNSVVKAASAGLKPTPTGAIWGSQSAVDVSGPGANPTQLAQATGASAYEAVVAWVDEQGGAGRVSAAGSEDGGESWNPPMDVSASGSIADLSAGSNPAGTVSLVAWSRDGTLEVSQSGDYGKSWSTPVALTGQGEKASGTYTTLFGRGSVDGLVVSAVQGKGLVAFTGKTPAAPTTPPTSGGGGEIVDGPAKVTLPECGPTPKTKQNTFFDQKVDDCSYVTFLTKSSGSTEYLYVTNQGAVTWDGSVASKAFTFPGNGQNWPNLTGLNNGASISWTPKDITGTISADQKVSLDLDLEANIAPLGCKVEGKIRATADGTENRGNSQGMAYNPATGKFAVAAPVTPIASTSSGCNSTLNPLDLAQGWSVYLTGTISQGPSTDLDATSVVFQTKVKAKAVAKRSKLRVRVRPDLSPTLQWKFKVRKKAKGGKYRFLKTKSGKVKIWKTKTAKHIRVLNLKKGKYKVRAIKRYDHKRSTSKAVSLKR